MSLERADLEEGLGSALGYEVPAFLRTVAEVRAIAGQDIFMHERKTSGSKLQLALLSRQPAASARASVLELTSEDDRLAIDGAELYWLLSAGLIQSKLDLALIEKTLGPMTIRTMRTLERLVARFLGD